MNRKSSLFLIGIIVVTVVAGTLHNSLSPSPEVVYIDGGLYSKTGESLSVIVTASDTPSAALAVESVGGQITSDLQHENAVAAIIPADKLDALAIHPDIRAIASGPEIKAAHGVD